MFGKVKKSFKLVKKDVNTLALWVSYLDAENKKLVKRIRDLELKLMKRR